MNLRFFRRHASWSEQASAYVDASLSPWNVANFEAHLANCDRCREQIQEQRSVRAALQALPEEVPGRSFRLTPAMIAPVAEDVPARKQRSRATSTTLAWGARVTAGAAAVALAAVVMVDVGGGSRGDGDNDSPVAAGGASDAAAPVQEGTVAASTEDALNSTTDATATAASPVPAAPGYDGGDVEGASAGEGNGESDDARPDDAAESETQRDSTEPPAEPTAELYSTTAPLMGTASLAASQEPEGGSDGWSLLGLEIALAAVLAAAVAVMFVVPRLRRG